MCSVRFTLMESPLTIGWRERVCLPEWGIVDLEAKADTGARSSAIDVKNLVFLDTEQVSFEVALSRTDRSLTVPITAQLKRRTQVKSSNGHISERVVVQTLMQLGPVTKLIDVSLICRKRMQCRMLIGRTALHQTFLVDSTTTYQLSTPPSRLRKSRRKPSLPKQPSPPKGKKPHRFPEQE